MNIPIPGAIYKEIETDIFFLVEGSLNYVEKNTLLFVYNGITVFKELEGSDTFTMFTKDFMKSFQFVSDD
jgi:hypothetical protein